MKAKNHNHESTRAVLNRMSRAIGHFQSVKVMVEEGRDCTDILIQLSAVRAEVTNISKLVLKDHLEHCVAEAVRENDEESMKKLKEAIDRLI